MSRELELMGAVFIIGGNVWDVDPDDEYSVDDDPVHGDIIGGAVKSQKIMEANEKTFRDAEKALAEAKKKFASAQAAYDMCTTSEDISDLNAVVPLAVGKMGRRGTVC